MESKIEAEGVWWLSSAPENRVPGTVRCDETGSCTLSLLGCFHESPIRPSAGEKTTIHGNSDFRGGHRVTLTGCRVVRFEDSAWMPRRDSYAAETLFAGGHFTEGDLEFKGASIHFSGLESWAEKLTGFAAEPDFRPVGFDVEWDIRRRPAKPAVAQTTHAMLSFEAYSYGHSEMRVKTVNEGVRLRLAFDDRLPLSAVVSQFVTPLQNFMTLACDSPNAVTGLHLTRSGEWEDRIDARVRWVYSGDDAKGFGRPGRLFGLEDVESRLGDLLGRWLACQADLASAFAVYFGVWYSPGMFADVRFQLVMQALTLYAKARNPKGHLPSVEANLSDTLAAAAPEKRAMLMRMLQGNPMLAAEGALVWLLGRHWEAFEAVAGTDRERFVNRLLNTMHHIQSRDPVDSLASLRGISLHLLSQQAQWLMKLCLLEELGFSPKEQLELVRRHPRPAILSKQAREHDASCIDPAAT